MPTEQSPISTAGLDVGYGGQTVVADLTLHVPPGGMLVLMGTNGSGKSTLLKTLAGLLAPVSGAVTVLGEPPGALPHRVAYLGQHPASSFTLPLRAADVVAMGRYAALGLWKRTGAADRAAARAAIRRMGVDGFANTPLSELSGGQQQRTHLAQALARQADVLLLDEPTAGLDIAGREALDAVLVQERARGVAVVMATHDTSDAASADSVLLLAHRVVAHGTPDEVLTDQNLRAAFGFTERH